jgi:hypothetical protein
VFSFRIWAAKNSRKPFLCLRIRLVDERREAGLEDGGEVFLPFC